MFEVVSLNCMLQFGTPKWQHPKCGEGFIAHSQPTLLQAAQEQTAVMEDL